MGGLTRQLYRLSKATPSSYEDDSDLRTITNCVLIIFLDYPVILSIIIHLSSVTWSGVTVDLEPTPGTVGARQEYTSPWEGSSLSQHQ